METFLKSRPKKQLSPSSNKHPDFSKNIHKLYGIGLDVRLLFFILLLLFAE
jgi:hypothetical protein